MIKVEIYFDPYRMAHCFYFTEDEGPRKKLIAKPMVLDFVETPPRGENVSPSLILPAEYTQALVEALQAQGIKTNSDAKLQGTLEATRYHLEDLRRMLALYDGPKISRDQEVLKK